MRAIALLPRDATNHWNLGLTFIGLHQIDRAEPQLRRALEIDPHLNATRQLLDALPASNLMERAATQ